MRLLFHTIASRWAVPVLELVLVTAMCVGTLGACSVPEHGLSLPRVQAERAYLNDLGNDPGMFEVLPCVTQRSP